MQRHCLTDLARKEGILPKGISELSCPGNRYFRNEQTGFGRPLARRINSQCRVIIVTSAQEVSAECALSTFILEYRHGF